VFFRSSLTLIVVIALGAAMGLVALSWPEAAFPAEIALLATILWLLGRAFPGRAGINVASVVVSLAAVLVIVIYAAVLLSKVNPLALVLTGAALTACTVALTILRRSKKVEERRGLAGYCERCGYDLRKSFECCPECGADIPADLARRRRWLRIGPDSAGHPGPGSSAPAPMNDTGTSPVPPTGPRGDIRMTRDGV